MFCSSSTRVFRRVLLIRCPPLSGHAGISPTTQLGTILYKIIRRSWGNTDAIDFVAIASSLQATNGIRDVCNTNRLKAVPLRFVRRLRNNTAQSLVLRTQGLPHVKNKRTSACISKMKAKFLSCGKRSTKNQGEQLQLVVVEAKGACVRRKLGAPRLAAVAARNPSSNTHIPCIRTLRIANPLYLKTPD